jgi:hypothetical protein
VVAIGEGGNVGMIADRKILQSAMAIQANGTGANPSHGHGRLQNFFVLKGKNRGIRFHEMEQIGGGVASANGSNGENFPVRFNNFRFLS